MNKAQPVEYVRIAAEGVATVYVLPTEAESIQASIPGVFEVSRILITPQEAEALNQHNQRVHAQQQWRRMAEQQRKRA